ncbi:MAG: Fe-S-containing protein [Nitrospirota bacterium]
MAVCTKCGVELKGVAKFCTACGSGIENGMHDEKKARVLAGEKKGPKTAVIISMAFAVVVAGWLIYNNTSGARSMDRPLQGQSAREGNKHQQYTPVTAQNGEVKVPLSALTGSAARYFVYTTNGKDIKFFMLRASDGTVRLALDACTACNHAKLGYRQNGETMVCNNCGMSFRSTDVGNISGGCSPIPLKNSQDGKTLTVKAKDLEEGVKYF